MTNKPIPQTYFETLLENLQNYFCNGYSRNIDAQRADDWDTLSFKYNGSSYLGLEFTLAHPYSRSLDAIDYNTIEVRFSAHCPFPQNWAYRITDPTQIARLSVAVKEPYQKYRNFGSLASQGSVIRHEDGKYVSAHV
jgi:hypothetical protein